MRAASRTITTIITAASLASPADDAAAQSGASRLPQRFNVDASHSNVGFAVRFMGLSTVRGAFADYRGTIMYDPDTSRASVSVIIDAASINSNNRNRDEHLRSPDFLDAKQFPKITFRSTHIGRGEKGWVAVGPLTMHGMTKVVRIPFEQLNAPTSDAWGNTRVTFQGDLAISRKEWGIAGTAFWNSEFDPGRMAVSDEVRIELLVSATISNPGRWRQPLGDSLLARIEAGGVAAAMQQFRTAYAGKPALDSVPEFAFVVAGEKLIQKGRVNDAITFYESVLALRPAATLTRQTLGEAYLKAGRPRDAEAAFTRVLAEFPESTVAAEWLRVLGHSQGVGAGNRH